MPHPSHSQPTSTRIYSSFQCHVFMSSSSLVCFSNLFSFQIYQHTHFQCSQSINNKWSTMTINYITYQMYDCKHLHISHKILNIYVKYLKYTFHLGYRYTPSICFICHIILNFKTLGICYEFYISLY